jgi:hypothetical protein
MRAHVAAARFKSDVVRRQLEDTRPRYRAIDVAFVSLERDAAAAGSVLGAAVGFRIFLFFVTYVFVIVYGFGLALEGAGFESQDLAAKFGIVGLLASMITVASDQSLLTRLVAFRMLPRGQG